MLSLFYLMPSQQHLYSLDFPALRTIPFFAREGTRPHGHRAGLRPLWLAYAACWPTACVLEN